MSKLDGNRFGFEMRDILVVALHLLVHLPFVFVENEDIVVKYFQTNA